MPRSPPAGDSEPESFEWTDRSADGLPVLAHRARLARLVLGPSTMQDPRSRPTERKGARHTLEPSVVEANPYSFGRKALFRRQRANAAWQRLDFAKHHLPCTESGSLRRKRCHPLRNQVGIDETLTIRGVWQKITRRHGD